MVSTNPIFAGKWSLKMLMKRFNATVLNDIWPEMWFFALVALMVCSVQNWTDTNLQISNQMLTVLGTVLGLVISFRTTSAYDRYWEGRKLWGSIALASRNLGQIIWIHVPIDRKAPKDALGNDLPMPDDSRLRAIIERKSMVNLVQAFSVSVKHFLRSEPGVYYEDLYPLLSFLPQEVGGDHGIGPQRDIADAHKLPLWTDSGANTLKRTSSAPGKTKKGSERRDSFDPEKILPHVPSSVPLRPARMPPKNTIFDYLPILLIFKPIVTLCKRVIWKIKASDEEEEEARGTRGIFGRKKQPELLESNVPLEIVLFLSSYLQMLLRNGLLQPAIATAYVNALMSLQDSVTNLERIRTTPIPFAYQTHLRLSVWLYLFFLPFEIHAAFKWLTIPATVFAAFLYLGFLEIGQEIENPFNYDANDLDLDSFCLQIERELSEITAHPAIDPAKYIFSMWNQPLAPADRRTAEDILKDTDHDYHGKGEEVGISSVRKTLLKSWREIGEATHHKHRPNLAWT